MIRWYCRESGVRNLEKHVEKLFRKTALKVARRVEEVGAVRKPSAQVLGTCGLLALPVLALLVLLALLALL